MNPHDFERLHALETAYEASDETKRQLARKVFVAVVGPMGVGKSTVIRQAVEFQRSQNVATWGEPGSIVTRDRRPDDPVSYRTADEGVREEELVRRIRDRSLTNYSLHPSGAMYATGPESFEFDYNLMPTLPSSIAQLKRAGFEQSHTAFITAEPHDLKRGLKERANHPSFQSRVREGIANVEYAIDNFRTVRFIRNSHNPGGKEMAADDLIAVSLNNYYVDDTAELHVAHAMHRYLNGLLD